MPAKKANGLNTCIIAAILPHLSQRVPVLSLLFTRLLLSFLAHSVERGRIAFADKVISYHSCSGYENYCRRGATLPCSIAFTVTNMEGVQRQNTRTALHSRLGDGLYSVFNRQ